MKRIYRMYRLFVSRKVLHGSSSAGATAYLLLFVLAVLGPASFPGSYWAWSFAILVLFHAELVADAGFNKGWLRK